MLKNTKIVFPRLLTQSWLKLEDPRSKHYEDDGGSESLPLARSQNSKWQYIENTNRKPKYILATLLFYALLSLFSLSCFATDAPSESIKTFYRYIAEQQCEQAVKLRPSYSIQRCQKISKVHIHKVTTEISDKNNAVLLLELDSFYDNKKSYFFGYVRLTKKKGQWLIVGPFKSRDDYWLDEYVKNYIPDKFKELKKAVTVNSEKKTPPPGDSIDADEFTHKKVKQSTDKAVTPHISANKNTVPNTTTTTTTNKQLSFTPEAEKFLAGHYPIEANYASLLKKIRQHFPTQATAAILLIDKSRRTIYAYNAQNLLLGALPILSSDNSSFPSGLYSLSSAEAVASNSANNAIGQQTHHPIALKRILMLNTNVKTSNNPLYYIRDLLDTDKNNSLQLSPLDSKKLQQFISSSAISYIGQ